MSSLQIQAGQSGSDPAAVREALLVGQRLRGAGQLRGQHLAERAAHRGRPRSGTGPAAGAAPPEEGIILSSSS